MTEQNDFYVCLFKQPEKGGFFVGHAVSDIDDFLPTAEKYSESLAKDTSEVDDASRDPASERFQKIFMEFANSMMGFLEMLPLIATIGRTISRNVSSGAIKSYVARNGEQIRSDDQHEVYRLSIEKYPSYDSINQKRKNATSLGKQIPKMMVLGVVSSFEHHISKLLKEILNSRPEIINSKLIEITLKDLSDFDSIDSMKSHYIDSQIESVMRESFSKQIDTVEKYLAIKSPIKNTYPGWEDLIELFERRNLFAHADGVVNKIYIGNVPATKHSLGQALDVSPRYFSDSIVNLFEFGVKLIFVAWRRECKSDVENIDDDLGDFCYSLVEAKQYKLAEHLLEFSLNEAAPCKEKRRMMNIVNLANCYRLRNNQSKAEKTLDAVDWSAAGDEFQICVASVRGEVETVLRLMKVVSQDKVGAFAYENWPVFYKVRENEGFGKTFLEMFGRPYSPAAEDRHSFLELMALVQEESETQQKPQNLNSEPALVHDSSAA
jgi:hypothetical protein